MRVGVVTDYRRELITELQRTNMLITCSSDRALPWQVSTEPLPKWLALLEQSVIAGAAAGDSRVLCFSPAPYGSAAHVESLETTAFAHHTLPSPAIPVPRGVDVIGKHVSQVE